MVSIKDIHCIKNALEQRRNDDGLVPEDWARLQAVRAYEMVYIGKPDKAEDFLNQAETHLQDSHDHLLVWGIALADFGFVRRAYGHLARYSASGKAPEVATALMLMLALRLIQHRADNRWATFINRQFMAPIDLPCDLPARVFDSKDPDPLLETLELLEKLEQTPLAQANHVYLFFRSEILFMAGQMMEVLETGGRMRFAGAVYSKMGFEWKAMLQMGKQSEAIQSKKDSLAGLMRDVLKKIQNKPEADNQQESNAILSWARNLFKNQSRQLICQVKSLRIIDNSSNEFDREKYENEKIFLDYFEVNDQEIKKRRDPFSPPAATVVNLQDAEILDPTTRLLVGNKELVRETLPEDPFFRNHWEDMEFGSSNLCLAGLPAPEVWSGGQCAVAAYGLAPGGANYFTWLINIMSGVQLYLNQTEIWRRANNLFFPYMLKPWQKRMLSTLGVEEQSIVEYEGKFPLKFDSVQYLSACLDEVPDREIIMQLRRTLWDRMKLKPGRPFRHLYITRENILNRRLVNEPDIRAMYEKAGYEVIRPELLTFEEQARLFSEAKSVAGPSGAWGANMLFCQPETTIAMICRSQSCDNIGAYHANLFGIRYLLAPFPFVPTAQTVGWQEILEDRGWYYLDSCHYNCYADPKTVENLIKFTADSSSWLS